VVPTRALAGRETAQLVVDVEGDAVTAREEAPTEEVVPQKARKRVAPVTKTKPTRRLEQGDLVCGQCGEGNAPTRKFCSRCGDELSTATPVMLPWFRRIFRRGTKTMEVGARPGEKGARKGAGQHAKGAARRTMKVIGLVSLGLGLVTVLVPQVREPVDDALGNPIEGVKGWVSDIRNPYERVAPEDWTANRRPAPEHGPQSAFDDNTLTFWATRWLPRSQRDTYLTVTFSEPVKDLAVYVYAGAPEEDFAKYHSPSEIRFDYGDDRTNDSMTLVRQQEVQELFELDHAEGATTITIWIEGVHSQKDATQVAISEFEFVQK
jgi:hypothetical protein